MIPYGRQDITEADIDAVVEVLRSDFLTQGPMVPRFEQAVADYCGASHAVAVNSGTSALHLACLALGVGPGDRVWTSPTPSSLPPTARATAGRTSISSTSTRAPTTSARTSWRRNWNWPSATGVCPRW
jgi:dTDP-4-amino-4,6-dideoxygalactose transaminase